MKETVLLRRGRGALSNSPGRYEKLRRCDIDDGWQSMEREAELEADSPRTQWRPDNNRTIITRNQSPDIHFDRSINPYRGCEHGCIYCFARPTHTWLGHSAGLDFERLLYAKQDAGKLLRQELAKPSYKVEPIAIGVNTDAYQPLERKLRITREILEILTEHRHPVYLISKSSLIERDLDLLTDLASDNLVSATISLTTLDNKLAKNLEPRATAPHRRLKTLSILSDAGIPTRVSLSPIIPALNEPEIEALVKAAADAGAQAAYAILLRLPHELGTLFEEWLRTHYPLRAERVLKAIRSMRQNKLNDAKFGSRMIGQGPRAEIIQRRIELACRKAKIEFNRHNFALATDLFVHPSSNTSLCEQLSLF